jgi:hypothetical protein
MPILAYCMLDPAVKIAVPPLGVRDSAIESLVESAIRCIVSNLDSPDLGSLSNSAPHFQKDDALRLHQVVSAIFQQAAVIPFRFPTLLPESELRAFVKENSAAYLGALSRLREMVQMELRITSTQSPTTTSVSGTEYLRTLQTTTRARDDTAAAAREAAGPLAQDWRNRPVAQGLRCYALVRRDDIGSIRERMQAFPISDMVTVTVSGPWPATEFLEATGAEGQRV